MMHRWFGTQLGDKQAARGPVRPGAAAAAPAAATGVGKYLAAAGNGKRAAPTDESIAETADVAPEKKRKAAGGFGDFSAW